MDFSDFSQSLKPAFDDMFVSYFKDDLGVDYSEEIIRARVCPLVLESWEKGIVGIAIAQADGRPVGFGIYQIDRPESDWCKRPGWGFVREFYIDPAHRRRGGGRELNAYIETALRELGATRAYLTSDVAAPFWLRLGYADSGERTQDGAYYLEKSL